MLRETDSPRREFSPARRILLLAFLTLFTVWLVPGTAVSWLEQARSISWPTAPGTVREIASVSPRRLWRRDFLRIRYDYAVAGVRHTSTDYQRIDLSTSNIFYERPGRIAGRLPAGSPVTVHYDPRDPSRACIRAGVSVWETLFSLFIIVAFPLATIRGWTTALGKSRQPTGPESAAAPQQ